MNKVLPWITVGVVGVGVGFLLRGPQQPAGPVATEQARAQLIQSSMAPAAGEKIAHTFPDQQAMQQFVTLWQQRQERRLRMGTLEGYWNNEQVTLDQINAQLTSQYGLDLAKRHVLDTDQRALIEQEAPAAAESAAAPSPEAPTPATPPAPAQKDRAEQAAAAPSEGQQVVHTFADDDTMQAFAELWQQRQSVIVRMAVLKAYWDSEKGLVDQLNTQLATEYQVDAAKSYALDEQRRILIERPSPPAPPLEAPAPPGGAASVQAGAGEPTAQPAAPPEAVVAPSQAGQ